MNNTLNRLSNNNTDPATLGWPASLPLEIALQTAPIETIREAYNISEDEWEALKNNEQFRKQILKYQQDAEEEGYSYRAKAKMQAEELLKTSFEMIHNVNTPPAVKADLIKFTARVAGYDAPKQVATGAEGQGFVLNINIPTANTTITANVPSHLAPYNIIDAED